MGAPAASLVTRPRVAPSTSAAIASGSSAATRSSGGGRRRNEATSRSSSASSGACDRADALRLRDERRDLDARGRALRDEALRRDASTRDRIGADEAGAARRHDDACAQARGGARSSRRAATVSSSAARRSRRRAASSKRWSRARRREPGAEGHDGSLDVVRLVAVERPRGAARDALRGERPEARRLVRDAPARSAAPEVDVTVGARAARVRRGSQVAQEPQLLERRLELGARLAPLDPLERAERRLDGGPLPLAGEVRAQARAQLPRAADVERHPAGAPEHVDARARRRARDERALRCAAAARAAPRARRGRTASGRRAPGRARSGRGGSPPSRGRRAGLGGTARSSTPKKCASVARPTRRVRSPSSLRASHTVSTTGAAMRLPVRCVTSRSRKARSKRALCATSAASPANARSCLTACSARGAPRSVPGWMPVSEATAGGSATPGSTSVSNASSSASARTRCAPISQIRDVRGERPVVSRSTTTKCACSRRTSAPGGAASPTDVPRQARRASPETTSSSSERARAAGALARAKSTRAASSAGTGPRRNSTSSTSRSAASNESCMAGIVDEHTFDYQWIPDAETGVAAATRTPSRSARHKAGRGRNPLRGFRR